MQAGCQDTLDTICRIRPIVRSAYLAKLHTQQGQGDQDSLLQSCKDYSAAFSAKAFCFDDLKDSLQRLDGSHLKLFIQSTEQNEAILAKLLALKVAYISISRDVSGSTTSRNQELLAFAYKALQLYQNSVSESPICPEAAVLAAVAILHLQNQGTHHEKVLVAISILEIARSRSEDYYILTVLLVQLQAHLGLLSLAMRNFMKLSVKSMQWETVSHLILTRISTLHPASIGDANVFEPFIGCETVIKVLQSSDNALVRGIREGLRFNSYSNICNSVKMRSEIERSMSKQICTIEGRKLARWSGSDLDYQKDLPLLDPLRTLVDNRDLSYLPNYRDDDRSMLARHRCGPQPRQGWINAMTLCDNVVTYLKAELSSHTWLATETYENLKRLNKSFSGANIGSLELKSELTITELLAFDTIRTLARAIIVLNQRSSQEQRPLPELLEIMRTALESALDSRRETDSASGLAKVAGIRVATWTELHTSFSEMEGLQTVSDFLSWISRKLLKGGKSLKNSPLASVSKESISKLQSLVTELEARIHADAKTLKSQINEPGVLGKLVDLCMARVTDEMEGETQKDKSIWNELNAGFEWEQLLGNLCDEAQMEKMCGRYRESWEDALDGVLATKTRVAK